MRFRADTGLSFGAALVAALAACSSLDQPPTTTVVADSADQIGWGLTLNMTVDGVRRMKLVADSTYQYSQSQRHRLFGIQVTFYSPDGIETSTLTAREGKYDWRTGDMDAIGDVVVVNPEQRRLTTTLLRYERRSDQIVGPEPFVWTTPTQRVEGEAFTADPELRNVQTTRARGSIGPVEIER